MLLDRISSLLGDEKISLFSAIPLSACKMTRGYLLEREGISDGTVIICAVPYLTPRSLGEHNISAYCASRDYHAFFSALWSSICDKLKNEFPNFKFAGFCDHSPIDERDAALRAGLGVLGKNGLLITEKYSSYVFLGELITNAQIPCFSNEPKTCESCIRCVSACPRDSLGCCLSEVTQKKGELSPNEKSAIAHYNTAWGCDICQRVCPYTERAIERRTIFTNIDFFLNDVIPDLSLELLNSLDDKDFSSRAFAWRGRKVIERNLKILESSHS